MNPFAQELQVARDLALAAGALAMRYRAAGLVVQRKAANEPVTKADQDASALILAGLQEAFPDDVLISEEAPDDLARLEPGRRVWYIDPIDGTQDFINGYPGFAPMIGLVVDQRPCLGVVYQPVGDRLFAGVSGQGATVTAGGRTRTIHCSTTATLAELRLVVSQNHPSKRVDSIRQAFGITDVLSMGSIGVKVGLIAADERDLYLSATTRANVWDTCAPEAILTEAGGRFTDLWGAPLRYGDPSLRHRQGLLASNGPLHDEIVRRLRPHLPATLT